MRQARENHERYEAQAPALALGVPQASQASERESESASSPSRASVTQAASAEIALRPREMSIARGRRDIEQHESLPARSRREAQPSRTETAGPEARLVDAGPPSESFERQAGSAPAVRVAPRSLAGGRERADEATPERPGVSGAARDASEGPAAAPAPAAALARSDSADDGALPAAGEARVDPARPDSLPGVAVEGPQFEPAVAAQDASSAGFAGDPTSAAPRSFSSDRAREEDGAPARLGVRAATREMDTAAPSQASSLARAGSSTEAATPEAGQARFEPSRASSLPAVAVLGPAAENTAAPLDAESEVAAGDPTPVLPRQFAKSRAGESEAAPARHGAPGPARETPATATPAGATSLARAESREPAATPDAGRARFDPSRPSSLPAVPVEGPRDREREVTTAAAAFSVDANTRDAGLVALAERPLRRERTDSDRGPARWQPTSRADRRADGPRFRELAVSERSGDEAIVAAADAFEHTPYRTRFGVAKQLALEEHGGGRETEAAVARGLAYLASIQNREGYWGDVDEQDPKYGFVLVGKTGLCLLAFLGAGHTQDSGSEHSRLVQRTLDFLLAVQDEDSGHFARCSSYGHAIATYSLAECYALTKDDERLT